MTYVDDYHGVSVFESLSLGNAEYRNASGITLPGSGIYVGKGSFSKSLAIDLLQHEYGHILQYRKIGYVAYYGTVAPESFMSASMNDYFGHSHSCFWTETWANSLSKNYFGSNYIGSSSFPVKKLSLFNKGRIIYHYPYTYFSL